MSLIGKVNAELHALKDEVADHTETGLAIIGEARFVSIPERCAQVNEIAEQLAGLLRGIVTDTSDYVDALKPFQSTGARSAPLIEHARRVTAGSYDGEVLQLPSTIWNIGEPGIHQLASISTGNMIQNLTDRASSLDETAKSAEKLSDHLQQGTNQVVKDFTDGTTKVAAVIDRYSS